MDKRLPNSLIASARLALLIHVSLVRAWLGPTVPMFCRSLVAAGVQKFGSGIIAPVSSLGRLFGSKAGIPGTPLGTIFIYNDQAALKDIDEDALRNTVHRIAKIIGYETYDVTLLLVDDDEMKETNLESRGINNPTDILSFPFQSHAEPGVLLEPEFDIPDYYTLGDMMVDIPYVIRRCKEDQENHEDDDERGVSGAMARVYDPEKRVHMLLVHGMLHLVGYDHEEDDEYELMVSREEEILEELGLMPTAEARS